jgi:ubiquitin carboxyl-terminal hydrolase 6/32
MACGISACCRGPMLERQKCWTQIHDAQSLFILYLTVCFKIFDADQDGFLNRKELEDMVAAMMVVRKENSSQHQLVRSCTSRLHFASSFIIFQ